MCVLLAPSMGDNVYLPYSSFLFSRKRYLYQVVGRWRGRHCPDFPGSLQSGLARYAISYLAEYILFPLFRGVRERP